MNIYYYWHLWHDERLCNNTEGWLPRKRGLRGKARGRGWMELDGVGKKSGIKLTVYSLQNTVCCSAVIFHEGLPCGAEWVRSPGEDATMEPFTVPPVPRASIHTSSFILEKKPGAPLQSAKGWGTGRNFRGTPSIPHQVFSERIERLRLAREVNFSAIYINFVQK